MRILFLTQVLPYPLDAGPKIRAYYVLRYLARNHDVTLISFVRTTDTLAALDHLREFCAAVHPVPMLRSRLQDAVYFAKSLATGHPFIIQRDWTANMTNQLAAVSGNGVAYDAIHADQLWMAPYALWAKQRANGSQPKAILDQHNAVFMIPRRMAQSERNPIKRVLFELEARKLMRYEIDVCRQFDHVTWVTREDYVAVQSQITDNKGPLPNSAVIPICGDPEAVTPVSRKPNGRRVTFLGGLHYPPNAQGILWFAKHIFPKVLEHAPDAVLTVLGKQPPPALNALGIPTANLEVTGYVDDLQPYLAETAVFVAPLLAGGGMRVKIIEGWTWGLPIVSTTVGAEGIEVQPGETMLVADTPEAFAQATLRLLNDRVTADRVAQAGRQWVLQHYNWRRTYQKWDKLFV